MPDSTWPWWCRVFFILTCPTIGKTSELPYSCNTHTDRWGNQPKDTFFSSCTQTGDPIREGKIAWREGDRSQINWNREYTPSHLREGKMSLKREKRRGHISRLPAPGSPSRWKSSCLTFIFYYHNKCLLNSFIIFLPLNSLSSRGKEPIPLDSSSFPSHF
jgi:hypothetical protein